METEKRLRIEGSQHCRRERMCHRNSTWRGFELVGGQLLKALHAQQNENLEKALQLVIKRSLVIWK